MNLGTWVSEQAETKRTSKRAVLEALAERSGVSFMTLESTARGARMGNYQKAKSVSAATNWKVTIPDLCDETPADTIRRIVAQVTP
jgi:transcriptional regulator with XRE-family HTH domain